MKIVSAVLLVLMMSCNSEKRSTDEVSLNATNENSGIATIGSEQAKSLLEQKKNIEILDVRTNEEYGADHLKNAQLLDFNAPGFSEGLKKLDKTKIYLIYCAAGGRSSKAAKIMKEMGFSSLYDASDGFSALKKVGIPTE